MKAVAVVVQAVLILAVVVALAAAGIPVAQRVISTSVESAEITNVRADFLKCSDKILDTARTGSGSKCALSASEGKLSVKRDGIYYSLLGNAGICAPQEWAIIDSGKQIWQRCEPSAGGSLYELKWFYPKNDVILLEGTITLTSVSGMRDFSLYQKGTLLVEFDSPMDLSGKTIELTRYSAAENTTVLSISIPDRDYSAPQKAAETAACNSLGGLCVYGTACPAGTPVEIPKTAASDCNGAGKVCCKKL